MIVNEPYHNLIALAPTGCGKTGAFGVGSVMRLDRTDPHIQVLVISHTRELCKQIFDVYEKIVKGTGITVINAVEKIVSAQIIIT